MTRVKRYVFNTLIALDQLVNTLCNGDPDETISSRVGKRRDNNEIFMAKVVNKIFFWQKDHSTDAIEHDEGDN